MRQALTLCGALWICGLLWPASAFAGTPLDIVEVRAPDINCIFDSDCRITVDDRVSAIPVPAASGDGRFQSRTAPIGEHGTVGEHLYPYEYRIDLRDVGALTAAVCVDRLEVPFGPVESVDYNDDGRVEQVFVAPGAVWARWLRRRPRSTAASSPSRSLLRSALAHGPAVETAAFSSGWPRGSRPRPSRRPSATPPDRTTRSPHGLREPAGSRHRTTLNRRSVRWDRSRCPFIPPLRPAVA